MSCPINTSIARLSAGLAALILASPAPAHHSYTGYDRSRSRSVAGTVYKVDWTNPHIHIWVYVPTGQTPQTQDVYGFEAGGVLMMTRFRWSRTTFQIGEKVSVTFFPLLDGRRGGAFIKARHEDGTWTTGDLAGVNYFSR